VIPFYKKLEGLKTKTYKKEFLGRVREKCVEVCRKLTVMEKINSLIGWGYYDSAG